MALISHSACIQFLGELVQCKTVVATSVGIKWMYLRVGTCSGALVCKGTRVVMHMCVYKQFIKVLFEKLFRSKSKFFSPQI